MLNKEEIKERIIRLKKKHSAIIIAHNYQHSDIQEVADFVGDSLEISQKAAQTDAEVIVVCGVRFMAESASILSPHKKVLIPDKDADCPLADMITPEELKRMKERYPQAVVVCYVNTSADVKAESDICCTSANADKVVESLRDKSEIIFVPDKHLAHYVSLKTKRKLIDWNGYCPVHIAITPEDVLKRKKEHPQAKVIVHPECVGKVIELADGVFSTSGLAKYARESDAQEIIVGTENGFLYRLEKENPEKRFYPASELAICPGMKKITLSKVLWSLENMQYEVKIPQEIVQRAKQAVDRMLEIR
ncbi:MAG: quinolinate synthase [Candidatus Omnitrophota bacterium]|nr:MAG: quinolinate synthase [Candidatus Omnitrophota bacterium]